MVVAMHSCVGILGAEALWGLARYERESRGFRGCVVRSVFIMSILAKEGSKPVKEVARLCIHGCYAIDVEVRGILHQDILPTLLLV